MFRSDAMIDAFNGAVQKKLHLHQTLATLAKRRPTLRGNHFSLCPAIYFTMANKNKSLDTMQCEKSWDQSIEEAGEWPKVSIF